jgi:hypothetical protein
MKLTWSTLLWTLLSCLFTGIIIISIGFGAAFPPIDRVARPFVCPHGQMEYEQQVYTPTPVETVTTTTWYCIDKQTGEKTELGIFPMSLYSGMVYGLLLFVAALIGLTILGRRTASNIQLLQNRGDANAAEILEKLGLPEGFQDKSKASGSARARMKELKELRDANLISEVEYEQKRAEILKEL